MAEDLLMKATALPQIAAGRGERRRRPVGKTLAAPGISYGFILPALAVYGLVVVYPMLAGAAYGFTNWDGLNRTVEFVGLTNFQKMTSDRQVLSSIWMSLVFALALVVTKIGFGLLLALALDSNLKSRNFLRLLFFMPVVLTPVIVSYVWKYIFSNKGTLNSLGRSLGLDWLVQPWLGHPTFATVAVIIVTAWQTVGLAMVIFLAGLQSMPRDLIEAARVDGGTRLQILGYITLPMLAPAITVNVALAMIQGMKFFDQVYVLTGGGPGYSTETLSTIIYKTAFLYGEFGYGAAIALVFSLIVGAVVFTTTMALRRLEIVDG